MKTVTSFCFTFLFVFAFLLPISAQKDAPFSWDKTISTAELQEDFEILRRHFEQIQPGLYTYTSKTDLDRQWDAIAAQIDRPMTEAEFFVLITPILKSIGNGHTGIDLSDKGKNYIRTDAKIFPLTVVWLEDALYISKNLSSNKDLPRGAKILSINGENAQTLFKKMRGHLTRDGYNLTSPNRSLYRRFNQYYPLFYGFPEAFELEIELADGTRQKASVQAATYPTIMQNFKAQFGKFKHWYLDKEPVLLLDIEGDIATMTIRTFGMEVMKRVDQNHEEFFQAAFDSIAAAGVKHLILDMRGNGGGDAKPTIELFQYLHDQPFAFYKEVSTITKKFPDKKLYKDKLFFMQIIAPILVKKEGDIYVTRDKEGLEEVQPKSPNYQGKLYVLTDAASFSATGEMTAIIKEHNRATFIGEEAGGNPNQNTSGMMLQLVLPNSKLNVTNPIVLWKMNVTYENTGHGLMPDHPLMPTIEEYIEGKDAVMNYTLKLIEKERKK